MKRCIYCGRDNDSHSKYCKYCGEALNVNVFDDDPTNDDQKRQDNQHIHCPKCDSTNIYMMTREGSDFNESNACCGLLLFGPLGLLCGLSGKKESITFRKCGQCGHEF
ncbi:MAG: zinc ribbon domain-containing protein [Candidatus Izemoplasmatales bacterium]